jgi:hypothetical protein
VLLAVFKVTLNVCVPAKSAALPGGVAAVSVVLIAIVWVTVLTKFQLASTALTVTVTAAPAVCAEGEPVLPVVVPAAAVSPGINTCNFAAAPALTVNEPLTPVDPLVAVMVTPDPALVSVTL